MGRTHELCSPTAAPAQLLLSPTCTFGSEIGMLGEDAGVSGYTIATHISFEEMRKITERGQGEGEGSTHAQQTLLGPTDLPTGRELRERKSVHA